MLLFFALELQARRQSLLWSVGGGNNRVTARDKFRSDIKPVMSHSRMERYPARHQHEGEERISGTGWNKGPESEERIE